MMRLNCAMMERYGIARRRPATVRAALFGSDRATLTVAARLLDMANGDGSGPGAVCFTPLAQELRSQDGMFTLLVRGEGPDAQPLCGERVVQSIIACVNPGSEYDRLLEWARADALELCLLSAGASDAELAQLARFLFARWQAGCAAPAVLLLDELPGPGASQALRGAVRALASEWTGFAEFDEWLKGARFSCALCDSLSGSLSAAERERAQRDMNYRDDFIAWAEPQLRCVIEGGAPELLRGCCADADYARSVEQKARIFDALIFLCAGVGFLCGLDSFAQTLKDEALRGFIGHAFFDELLPGLPWPREEVGAYIITCFSRLEDASNDIPLLEAGRFMLSRFPRSVLPAISSFARREFEAPPKLTLALAAAIMLYAGARENDKGKYEVLRGDAHYTLCDDRRLLEAFGRLSHDMPSETLAYAVLADRELWGGDLREIDGLELRLSLSLSSIQRTGLRAALHSVMEG